MVEALARVNVAHLLDERAAQAPHALAVRCAQRGWPVRFHDTTFEELARKSRLIASGLLAHGLERGERVCLFVRPGADFVACTYALLRAGLVPVLIDPGMGRKALLACVERAKPAALVAVAPAHMAARLFPQAFASARLRVHVGGGIRLAPLSLNDVEAAGSPDFVGGDTAADDEAAVLFTSGSTGPPKGVVNTHRIFSAQVRALQDLYGFGPGEIDVACFPLFALFDTALGMTSVFPVMNSARPARCNPASIHGAIAASGATMAFASPAVWRRVVPWCEERGHDLRNVRCALTAGAPIPPRLVERLTALLAPNGQTFTPYGATECLPVANVSNDEILEPTARTRTETGYGTLVGALAPGVDVRIVRIDDEPVAHFEQSLELPRGEIGEVWVRAEVASPRYQFDEAATRAAKVAAADGFYHRMGDLGRLDEGGRLWFCGRRAHRVRTRDGHLPNVPIENVFLTHPAVARCALVGVGAPGAQRPVLIVEPVKYGAFGRTRRPALARELLAHGRERSPLAERIEDVLFKRTFPVDPRHNAKIVNEQLAVWATARLDR